MLFVWGSCRLCGGQFTCVMLLMEKMPALCPACWWEGGCRPEDDGRASWDDELIVNFERRCRWELLPNITVPGLEVHLAGDQVDAEEVQFDEP